VSRFQPRFSLAMVLSVGLAGLGCTLWNRVNSADAANSSVKPDKERKPAPDFALKDADGKTVRLSDYRGKVVLLDFWATWCGPCKIEIPWFIEFERKNKDKGFAVIGVSMDEEGWTVVKPFIADLAINYRILQGDDQTATLFGGVDSLPTTFLIDRDGKIASVHVGLAGKDAFENGIKQLLGTSPSSLQRTVPSVPAFLSGAE
jgi:peroxiredoxin